MKSLKNEKCREDLKISNNGKKNFYRFGLNSAKLRIFSILSARGSVSVSLLMITLPGDSTLPLVSLPLMTTVEQFPENSADSSPSSMESLSRLI